MKQKIAVAGLVIALVYISACGRTALAPGPGHKHGQEDKREFEISIYTDPTNPSQCFADWPAATLWKAKHQTVRWISDDGLEYTVDFTAPAHGSPFGQDTFKVPANGSVPSGVLTGTPRYYDYQIRDAQNAICKPNVDPGLYVK